MSDTDYNSLREKLNELKKETNYSPPKNNSKDKEINPSYRKVSWSRREGNKFIRSDDTRNLDYVIGSRLNKINNALLKGNFHWARSELGDLYSNISSTKKGVPSKLVGSYSKEEKEKLVEGINRRIGRGIKYLKKHATDENVQYMEDILKKSKDIEDTLFPKKSGLEKSLAVLFFGSFLAGLLFSSRTITGNAIGVSQNSMNFIGIGLMLFGVLGYFVYKKMN